MNIENYNPDDIGQANGNLFGLPFNYNQSKAVVIPVPWDVTTSNIAGTSRGPQAILDYSPQLDLFSKEHGEAWKNGFHMLPIENNWLKKNDELRDEALKYIEFLETGGSIDTSNEMQEKLKSINKACFDLKEWVYIQSKKVIDDQKLPIVLGGEHSCPLGLMEAINENYNDWAILQIDAHADLRSAYEGFTLSHASIMYNALSLNNLSKLISVGVRDFCKQEYELAKDNQKVVPFYMDDLCELEFVKNESWQSICQKIVEQLPQNIYISFDIDGLDVQYCPNTGTPVPGGLNFNKAMFLLNCLKFNNKNIIAADLCEVSTGRYPYTDNAVEINANVGARVLFNMLNLMVK